MKALVFHIGADRYALPLGAVARVLPAAALKQVPLAPPWVAGVLDLHGVPVPVIDVSRLVGLQPDEVWVDTRIVLIDYPLVAYPLAGGVQRQIGLLAEHVTGIDTIDTASLADAGVRGAPFLGQVASGSGGMVQLIALDQLLTDDVRALLFDGASGNEEWPHSGQPEPA